MSSSEMLQPLSNLTQLTQRYKGVLLDQFGVLHDGRKPYPGSVAAVRALHAAKLPIYVLSNSSQRSITAYDRLEPMGFQREWITGHSYPHGALQTSASEIITSGEMTFQQLYNRRGAFWETLGKRCLHFTWSTRGKIQLQELNLQVVTTPEEAEFILVHGTDALGLGWDVDPVPQSYAQLESYIHRCAGLPVLPPMIVANPDYVTVDGASLKRMPGSLGLLYQKLGGEVLWMGKPGRLIYDYTLSLAQCRPAELIAIGDSLEHDIKGAEAMGIDSVFVGGGIHAAECFTNGKSSFSAVQALCRRHSANPAFYMDYFRTENDP